MTNGNGGSLSPSGDVEVITDLGEVEIIQDELAGDVSVSDEDPLTQIFTGDQGPPGPRGNSVLYGYGPPSTTTGVNGDFYIDLRTALMYGPKAGGTWPPGFSLIGPIGPVGPAGPQGPVGAPGNTVRNGSGPPDPSLGVAGDFYIDTSNHNIYGPKSNTVVGWGSPTSLIGPQGPQGIQGPVGPPPWTTPPVPWATNTAYTVGPPASLVTNAGASYVPTVGHISGVDFSADLAAGLWTLVAAAGSPGQVIAQVYVGDTPPTGIQNNSLWWNSTDGCLYVYYFDGNSHQWVIAAPVPDLSGYLQIAGGTMTGALVLAADPTTSLQAATKNYVDLHSGGIADAPSDGSDYGRKNGAWDKVVPLAGGVTMTGLLTLSGPPTSVNGAATKAYADTKLGDAPSDGFTYGRANGAWSQVLPLTGGTLTGNLILNADPTNVLGACTKQYADTKAPVASPAFTGNPTAPTQAVDDNSTKLATTAYVTNQLSASGDGTPAMDGTAARGTSTHGARADHVHPTDTSRAPIASPTFTGTPAAPTAAPDTNTTQLATTAFVIGQASAVNPLMNGAVAIGTSLRYARADHVHPSDTTKIGDAPADGNIYGRKNNAWVIGGGGAQVYIQDTAPKGISAGSLWWQSSTGQLFVYYNDGTSTQWVFAAIAASVPVIRSYLSGYTLSTAGGSASFSVTTGQAADSNNVDMISLNVGLTKTTAAWAVGNNAGALDAGTLLANNWYNVFAIKRPDTQLVDILISLSATAPTLPANYTLFRRIGCMLANASSQWTQFFQLGDEFYWYTAPRDVSGVTITSSGSGLNLTVPPNLNFAIQAVFNAVFTSLSASVAAAASVYPSYTTFANAGAQSMFSHDSGNSGSGMFRVQVNNSGAIGAKSGTQSGAISIDTMGWIDRRGRDL